MAVSLRDDDWRRAAGVFDQNCRELWGAVVLQAREDIRLQLLDSLE